VGVCALDEMAESYHIALRDYTIPTVAISIIATGITFGKMCANFEVCKCTVGRKFIQCIKPVFWLHLRVRLSLCTALRLVGGAEIQFKSHPVARRATRPVWMIWRRDKSLAPDRN
jgi:hypothetical protein